MPRAVRLVWSRLPPPPFALANPPPVASERSLYDSPSLCPGRCRSINQDVTLNVPEFPAPGQTLLARGAARAIGGKGANQALAAAMAGAQVGMLGCVARTPAARMHLHSSLRTGSMPQEC